MKQYEIRWARMPDPIGFRPVLLLTRTPGYSYLRKILAAEVTTRIRGIAQEVLLTSRDGMPKRCAVKLENVHLVPIDVLEERIATLRASRIVDVKRALGHTLLWPELMAATS